MIAKGTDEMRAKLLRMTKKRPGESTDAFRRRWIAQHKGQQAVVTFSTGEVALGGKEAPFDGMSVVYFPNEKSARAAAEGLGEDIVLVCDEHLMSQKPKAEWKVKIVRTVYKRKDLSHRQFKDYWLKNHAKLEDTVIVESPVQRIVATFAIPEPGKDPAFDGMVELYFKSLADLRALFASPTPAMMRKDEENFVQMDAPAIRVICEELRP
jgi:uncharacterized protein (TIGR02118 family)